VRVFDRFRSAPLITDHEALETAVCQAFSFLEERGFERTGSSRFAEGVEVRYRNRARGIGLRLFARSDNAAWGWIGPLDAAGKLRPLDRDTVDDETWRDLGGMVGVDDSGDGPLQDRVARLAEGVRTNIENLAPPKAHHG
jgi:hypothetical protein